MLFNGAWGELHGMQPEGALGHPADEAWPEGWSDRAPRLRRLHEQQRAGFERLHIKLGASGRQEEMLWHHDIIPVLDERGRVAGFFEQAHELSSQALQEHRRALESLNYIATATIAEKDPEKILQMVTDAGVELSRAAFGAFFYHVVNEAGERMMLYTLSGAPRAAFAHFPMPRRTILLSETFESAAIIRLDDITADPRYGLNLPLSGMPKGHLPVSSYMAVPVASREGRPIGTLLLGHPARARFTARHEELMRGLAAQAAIAIENARLIQRVREANETLEQRVAARTKELTEAHEALRQAQKMEAVGQLTGGIAHDFNNLLQGISGSLELLGRRLEQGQTQGLERFLRGAQDSAQRAASLTQRLLAFSRRQTLDPRPVDAGRLVKGVSDLIQRAVGPAITLDVMVPEDCCAVLVDAVQLENALLNLSINARDAMPNGGRLSFEITHQRLDAEKAREFDLPLGEYLSICVTDTGFGIPKDILGRIFDPFFTTKPVGQGTGLGLSMVHGFVRQSGGHVDVQSMPGLGTRVFVYLPCHTGEAAPETETEPAPGRLPRARRGERVLVVDDEVMVRAPIVEMLREAGFEVLEAEHASAAQSVLREQKGVRLLVADLGLPGGVDGQELAVLARAADPTLKVLFITGYAEQALSGQELEPGMAVIAKPFAMTDLAQTICEMLRG